MPTARELLEQAEALMQRDRAALLGDGIPTLTDRVPTPGGVVPGFEMRGAPTTLDDIPMLTETIEDFDTPSIPLAQSLDDELALWRNSGDTSLDATAETREPAVTEVESHGPVDIASATVAAPVETMVDPSVQAALVGAPAVEAAPEPIDDSARWNALAEDIRMQVLQRIDIFTDTGLKDQLNQRLQPIVDRASADLVTAINQHVGQLLRAYVAEAIEREIEKWRANSR
ncbi:MAG TPA: hypothetical protein VGK44_17315 [Casimicrobiaceae bacterium]|jgi:hypothetical protein